MQPPSPQIKTRRVWFDALKLSVQKSLSRRGSCCFWWFLSGGTVLFVFRNAHLLSVPKAIILIEFHRGFSKCGKGGEGENSYEIRLGNSALEILVGFLSHGFFVLVPVG